MTDAYETQLLIKKVKGELSSKEEEQFVLWLNTSPENQRTIDQWSLLWEKAKDPAASFHADKQMAWQFIQQKLGSLPESKPIRFQLQFKIAASILIVLSAAALAYWYGIKPLPLTRVTASNTPLRVSLPDHSTLLLEPHASISYESDYGQKQRLISFEGQAFFDIRKDSTHPFIIKAPHAKVTVLGTSFIVNDDKKKDSMELNVLSGKVLLENIADVTDQAVLYKGDRAILSAHHKILLYPIPHVAVGKKTLIFQKQQLVEVIAILEKEFKVRVEFVNPEIKSCLYSGFIEKTTIHEVLDIITTTMDLSFKEENGIYLINGTSCL